MSFEAWKTAYTDGFRDGPYYNKDLQNAFNAGRVEAEAEMRAPGPCGKHPKAFWESRPCGDPPHGSHQRHCADSLCNICHYCLLCAKDAEIFDAGQTFLAENTKLCKEINSQRKEIAALKAERDKWKKEAESHGN